MHQTFNALARPYVGLQRCKQACETYISTCWTISTVGVFCHLMCMTGALARNSGFHDNLWLYNNLCGRILGRFLRYCGEWKVWRYSAWIFHFSTGSRGSDGEITFTEPRWRFRGWGGNSLRIFLWSNLKKQQKYINLIFFKNEFQWY